LIHFEKGAVVGAAFPPETPPEARRTVRTILAFAQAPRGRLSLEDVVGTKRIRATQGAGTVSWKPVAYVAHTGAVMKTSVEGSWSARWRTGDVLGLRTVGGSESVTTWVTKSSQSVTKLSGELRWTTNGPAKFGQRYQELRNEPLQPLWVRPAEEDVRRALAKHTLRDLTRAQVILLVERLGTKDQSDQSGTDAFAKLRALYILDDSSARDAVGRLKTLDPNTPQFVAYSQALISAGTPEAQRSFLDVLAERSQEPAAAQKLLVELVGLEHPTTASLDRLVAFAESAKSPMLASSSVLMLGRFANQLATRSPSQANSVVARLGHGLRGARDHGSQSLYLGALGNAGQASCLPYISKFAASKDVALRSEAIRALRFIPDPAVDRTLCDKTLHDPSEEVRQAALFALGFRPYLEADFGAELLALRSDPSESVRLAALTLLWSQRDRQPAIVALVSQTAKHDPSATLRKRATELLQSK
jgi:hypothetical protein